MVELVDTRVSNTRAFGCVGSTPTLGTTTNIGIIMNTKIAARMMWELVEKSNLPDKHDEYGKDHLKYMMDKLMLGDVEDEKAHRWIGWIQGCLCTSGSVGLNALKKINKEA
jgi:hypothetical protein